MRLRRLVTKEAVLLSGVLLTAASCSFLFDVDQVQCETKDDCAGFTGETGVREVVCSEGICGYLQLTPPTTSTTGSAGAGGTPECTTNDECIDKEFGPAVCRDEECMALATEECPVVLGTGEDYENLKAPKEPFIFGAFGSMGTVIPENTATIANYDFAISEVNDATDGGYYWAGKQRPFVAVVCNSRGEIPVGMQHLVQTLKVPGIISPLLSKTLFEAFTDESYGAAVNNVFMLSTTFADTTLTNEQVDPDRLLWHMLGDGVDQAAAFKPLVAKAEAYLRAQQGLPTEEPIRVAMVVADDPYLEDIASVITSTVQFNGKSVPQNAQAEDSQDRKLFQRIDIESAIHTSEPNLFDAYNALRVMEPHLVLAITSHEFMYQELIGNLETAWYASKTMPPPFYLLSPYVARSLTIEVAQEWETPPEEAPENLAFIPLRQRILGVSPAGAADTSLYDKYLLDFEREYMHLVEEGIVLAGTENYYDAAYFMMYAIHGAYVTTNLAGTDVSKGMARLLGGGNDYNVGRDQVAAAIRDLRLDETGFITLNGTMGPPDFRPSGARINVPSVYCIDLDPEGSDDAMAFYPDALDFDPATDTLSGGDPCSIDGFMEEP